MNFFDAQSYLVSLNLLKNTPGIPEYKDPSEADRIFEGVKVCSFTGHRPEKMGIDEETDERCIAIKVRLRNEIYSAISKGYKVFITGMARGVDTWAAEAVLEASFSRSNDVELYAAIPYPGQPHSWYQWEQERYQEILRLCKGVFLVSKKYSSACMARRNEFLVKHGDLILSVYSGLPGGTARTIEMAKKEGKEIRIIDPETLTK